ncbi:G-type lectin S-receptor-like serine/threonine-protein kinase At1g11410 isoform X3 [Panicum virgatum]|uniref:G-type lectin S-receptor-like serine/threonine-protein kinase At1g11410 isoform X3 n=1 Tax=Panicum virgatum TaxID=38727 RepID=UPI0019D57969|nr:G-type lectin S-receptor-like serine/threonine-protein kinase At1g11410 isoform X3 [Panicum virgatum]
MAMAYFPAFIFLFMVCLCQSDDRLTPAKPLLPGDVLISEGGVFAIGFFSLKNSTSSSYVGIWYNNIPERTYVWIANRDNPITTNMPGKLVFTNSSDLVLLDSTGHTIWTTRNNFTAGGGETAAVLLDSGNLVIQSPNGTGIWESFHYPTDTIVPNVRFSLSSVDVTKRLVAWKGPNDPSSSNFSMGGDTSSDLQIVIWNGTRPHWRRAAWGGEAVFGKFQRNSNFVMSQTIVNTGDGYYFTVTVSVDAPSVRLTLDYTGMLNFQRWNSSTSSWTVFEKFPSPTCDRYAFCGPFGYCDSTEYVPTCKCLDGYEPIGLNFSQGCQRKEELKCGNGESFLTLPTMKTPDKFLYIKNRTFDQCTAECSHNCSCTAYAYANLKNVNTTLDQTRCLVWMGELVDVEKFDSTFGENLYLRVPRSPVSKKSTVLKIIVPVMATFLLLITCIWLVCKSRGKHQSKKVQKNLQCLNPSNEPGNENLEFPLVNFEDIITATNNFSDYKMLGKGGFGKVYKGMLEGGKEVAIKRLSKGSMQGAEEFRNEVVLIAKLQHRNLVRLLGFCIHEDEKLLIYEFLSNKSLDAFLFDATRKSSLHWPTRFKIIKGVARGLLYLHQDSRLTIIHRDLKASNILLDTDMCPKISDFGMARIFCASEQQVNTTRVVGTYGYMLPEYSMECSFFLSSLTFIALVF